MNTDPATRLGNEGLAALRAGDAAQARAAFEQIDRMGRGTHQLRLLLAQACTIQGDAAAAHRALDQVLATEPNNLYAILMRGDLIAATGDDRAAVSWYQAALAEAPRAGTLPADLLAALRQAEASVERAGAAFDAHLAARLAADGIDRTVDPRFAEALELVTGRAEIQLQQPTSFFYPQLPQRPFFERGEFAWVAALEDQAPAILAELSTLLAAGEGLRPYVTADVDRPAKRHALLDDPRWSAFHFYQDGVPVVENIARCPRTAAILDGLPIPRIAGRSPMALFSVLDGRTHIPPHHGLLNTRLICHLPLIVPDGCRLRVGNTTRPVKAGQMLIFDDSMRHEAWNDSDETRVVLLFEIWRPELGAGERRALTSLFEAIGAYDRSA